MFPVQIVCWILPGTRSFLNFAGREEAREGMCRSPITRIRTMADDVVRLRFEVEADRLINQSTCEFGLVSSILRSSVRWEFSKPTPVVYPLPLVIWRLRAADTKYEEHFKLVR